MNRDLYFHQTIILPSNNIDIGVCEISERNTYFETHWKPQRIRVCSIK